MISFNNYSNITKVIIPNSIQLTNTSYANLFKNRQNLITIQANHPNVTNMAYAFYNCTNLKSSPFCGDKVTNMANSYCNCKNLSGPPVCGNNVTNMTNAYRNCHNMTGVPKFGSNVTMASYAYYQCHNINEAFTIENKVTDLRYAFYNCKNLPAGDYYIKAPNITNVYMSFYGKNNSRRYNIHVPGNSTTLTKCKNTSSSYSLVGASISWTNGGTYFYNTTYNIYLYPDL